MAMCTRTRDRLDRKATSDGLSALQEGTWKCNSVFIIFNHEESYRRCIRDYSAYNR
jgi:hypothetical protein